MRRREYAYLNDTALSEGSKRSKRRFLFGGVCKTLASFGETGEMNAGAQLQPANRSERRSLGTETGEMNAWISYRPKIPPAREPAAPRPYRPEIPPPREPIGPGARRPVSLPALEPAGPRARRPETAGPPMGTSKRSALERDRDAATAGPIPPPPCGTSQKLPKRPSKKMRGGRAQSTSVYEPKYV